MKIINEKDPISGPEFIECPECGLVAKRVGAQDGCDVYVCDHIPNHLTRKKVGWHKTNELD